MSRRYVTRFRLVEDYLRAELVGRKTAGETEEFLETVRTKMEDSRRTKLLIYVRSSVPIFRVGQYGISGYFDWLASHPAVRVALVTDTSEVRAAHEYVEFLATQRGVRVRSFSHEEDAINWLRQDPEKQ